MDGQFPGSGDLQKKLGEKRVSRAYEGISPSWRDAVD